MGFAVFSITSAFKLLCQTEGGWGGRERICVKKKLAHILLSNVKGDLGVLQWIAALTNETHLLLN